MSRTHAHTHTRTHSHKQPPVPPPAARTRWPPPAVLCAAHCTSQGGQRRGSTAGQRGQAACASTKPSRRLAPAPSESPPISTHWDPPPPCSGAQLPPCVPAIYNAGGSQAWIWLLWLQDEPVGTGMGDMSQAELGRTQPDPVQGSGCPAPRLGVRRGLGGLRASSRVSPRLPAYVLG